MALSGTALSVAKSTGLDGTDSSSKKSFKVSMVSSADSATVRGEEGAVLGGDGDVAKARGRKKS